MLIFYADDNSKMEPPDPFPNSEVKRLSADGSVVCPCESRSSSAPYLTPLSDDEGVFCVINGCFIALIGFGG